MKRVLGIVGSLAAGKDTVAGYISDHLGWPVFQISDILKHIANEREIIPTRDNLCKLSKDLKEEGDGYLAEIIIASLSPETDACIIAGMRQLGQITYLQDTTKLFLLGVDADQKVRFERAKQRGKLGDAATFEKFLSLEQQDNDSTVQQVSTCLKLCDVHIDNSGTQEKLHEQLDHFLEIYTA